MAAGFTHVDNGVNIIKLNHTCIVDFYLLSNKEIRTFQKNGLTYDFPQMAKDICTAPYMCAQVLMWGDFDPSRTHEYHNNSRL